MCSQEDGCSPDALRRAFLAGSLGAAVAAIAGPALGQSATPAPAPPPTPASRA